MSLILMLLGAPQALAETLEVERKIPHSGYSEGLDFKEGYLWHALPEEIVKIDPRDGRVVGRWKPATAYSESLVWVGADLWNVSYSDNGIYRGKLQGDKLVFQRVGSVPEKHAWGMEFDGKHLVVTGNYSSVLYFLDPATAKVARQVRVPARDLEDLAWDGEAIWTSSFTEKRGTIFKVDPATGAIGGTYQLPDPEDCPIVDGLAYDGSHLWITGKHCPYVYRAKRPAGRALSSRPR